MAGIIFNWDMPEELDETGRRNKLSCGETPDRQPLSAPGCNPAEARWPDQNHLEGNKPRRIMTGRAGPLIHKLDG